MITKSQRAVDVATIRGILDLFAEDTTITVRLVAMTQHVSMATAKRLLLDGLEAAGILEQKDSLESEIADIESKIDDLEEELECNPDRDIQRTWPFSAPPETRDQVMA
jgi:hypothetical protein